MAFNELSEGYNPNEDYISEVQGNLEDSETDNLSEDDIESTYESDFDPREFSEDDVEPSTEDYSEHDSIEEDFNPDDFGNDAESETESGESEFASTNTNENNPESGNEMQLEDSLKSDENENPQENAPRQLKTKNSGLEGQEHPVTGVSFVKKEVTTESGEQVEGVFPEFESKFDAQLPEGLELASDEAQFEECNRQLKEKYESDPTFRDQFDERQKDNIESGYTPYGYTWHHNEETGKMQLVDYDTHQKTGHTGGRSIWGGGSEYR